MEIRNRIKELRKVTAKSLKSHPSNWRKHPHAQRQALRGILEEVGYADALIARELPDGTLELIDGHLRAETTPDMEVPVLVLDVDEDEARKLLATIDPLAALAESDGDKLRALLEQLKTDNAGLQAMYEDLAREAESASASAVLEDRAPEPLAKAVTCPGDLWLLGEVDQPKSASAAASTTKRNAKLPAGLPKHHRLLCGDSTNIDDVRRVMDGSTAALVATDPPYLVDYTGQRPKHGERDSGKDWSNVYREVDILDADRFFTALFTNIVAVVAPKAAIYCWHAHRRCGLIQRVWEQLGILDHQQIIWVKPASVFGRVFWHFKHEPCMMGWVKGSQPKQDPDHRFDSVWEIAWEATPPAAEPIATTASIDAAESDQSGPTKSRPGNNEHPTQKPVEIFARPMRRHTKAGEICFEPFSGSGSQLIAAQQLSRRCFAIELEPVFVDVAIRRWQRLTGKQAVLESTGQTWAERAAERGVEIPPEDQPPKKAARRGEKKSKRGGAMARFEDGMDRAFEADEELGSGSNGSATRPWATTNAGA
jgi:DNA modification methylase